MKSKELLSYLSDVDEKYLADVDLSTADPKSPRRFKWLILVPAAILLIAAVSIPILVIMHRGQPAAPDPVTDSAASETATEKSNIAIEEVSLCFKSLDELNQALAEYKGNKEIQADRRYIYNKFDELHVGYYPTVNSDEYELLRIEVNPYSVFYYFVPAGAKVFEYKTGIVVTFPREAEATIKTVGSQLNASYEPDGSFFDAQNRTWFLPLDGSYYSIRFPADMENCDKSIVALHAAEQTSITTEPEESTTADHAEMPDYSKMSIVSIRSGEGGVGNIDFSSIRDYYERSGYWLYDATQPEALDVTVSDFHFVGKYYNTKYLYGHQYHQYNAKDHSQMVIDDAGHIISFFDNTNRPDEDTDAVPHSDEECLERAKSFFKNYADNINDYQIEVRTAYSDTFEVWFTKCIEGYETNDYAHICLNKKSGRVYSYNSSRLNEIDVNEKLPFDMKGVEQQLIEYLDEEAEARKVYEFSEGYKYLEECWHTCRPEYDYKFEIVKMDEKRYYVECYAHIALINENGEEAADDCAHWFTFAPQ